MIKQVISLLMTIDHFNQSELIEIAKGRNEIPKNWKKGFTQIKREMKWLTKK
jgi:hypothetical protein